jgi:hypothetical protein
MSRFIGQIPPNNMSRLDWTDVSDLLPIGWRAEPRNDLGPFARD